MPSIRRLFPLVGGAALAALAVLLTAPGASAASTRGPAGTGDFVPLTHPHVVAVTGPGITHNPAATPDAVTAQIVNRNSGKCLEVYHSSTSNAATVDQWTCNNTATQNWHFVQVGTSQNQPVDEIINNHSGKCLEVYHSSTSAGAKVDQYTCNGTATQHWMYHDPHTGVGIAFLNMNSGMILEVAHSSTANGAAVDQYWINYSKTQDWDRPEIV